MDPTYAAMAARIARALQGLSPDPEEEDNLLPGGNAFDTFGGAAPGPSSFGEIVEDRETMGSMAPDRSPGWAARESPLYQEDLSERMARRAEDAGRGYMRGLGEAGYGIGAGAARLTGFDETADDLLESRDQMSEYWGGSDAAAMAGRLTGELGTFMVPGAALGKIPRVKRAMDASRNFNIGANLGTDVAVDASIGAGEREASMLGIAANLRDNEGGLLDRAADNPYLRGAFEAGVGLGVGGPIMGYLTRNQARMPAREAANYLTIDDASLEFIDAMDEFTGTPRALTPRPPDDPEEARLDRMRRSGFDPDQRVYQANIDPTGQGDRAGRTLYSDDPERASSGAMVGTGGPSSGLYEEGRYGGPVEAGGSVTPMLARGRIFDMTDPAMRADLEQTVGEGLELDAALRENGYTGIRTEDGVRMFSQDDLRSPFDPFDDAPVREPIDLEPRLQGHEPDDRSFLGRLRGDERGYVLNPFDQPGNERIAIPTRSEIDRALADEPTNPAARLANGVLKGDRVDPRKVALGGIRQWLDQNPGKTVEDFLETTTSDTHREAALNALAFAKGIPASTWSGYYPNARSIQSYLESADLPADEASALQGILRTQEENPEWGISRGIQNLRDTDPELADRVFARFQEIEDPVQPTGRLRGPAPEPEPFPDPDFTQSPFGGPREDPLTRLWRSRPQGEGGYLVNVLSGEKVRPPTRSEVGGVLNPDSFGHDKLAPDAKAALEKYYRKAGITQGDVEDYVRGLEPWEQRLLFDTFATMKGEQPGAFKLADPEPETAWDTPSSPLGPPPLSGKVETNMPGRWYSRTAQAIEDAPFEKGTPAQWRARLTKNVPSDERFWTGVEERLQQAEYHDEMLTKDELLEVYQSDPMTITEITRSRNPDLEVGEATGRGIEEWDDDVFWDSDITVEPFERRTILFKPFPDLGDDGFELADMAEVRDLKYRFYTDMDQHRAQWESAIDNAVEDAKFNWDGLEGWEDLESRFYELVEEEVDRARGRRDYPDFSGIRAKLEGYLEGDDAEEAVREIWDEFDMGDGGSAARWEVEMGRGHDQLEEYEGELQEFFDAGGATGGGGSGPQFEGVAIPGDRSDYYETTFQVNAPSPDRQKYPGPDDHWETEGNIVSHVRGATRRTTDGVERGLMPEEFQSDWHQDAQGADGSGYDKPLTRYEEMELVNLRREIAELEQEDIVGRVSGYDDPNGLLDVEGAPSSEWSDSYVRRQQFINEGMADDALVEILHDRGVGQSPKQARKIVDSIGVTRTADDVLEILRQNVGDDLHPDVVRAVREAEEFLPEIRRRREVRGRIDELEGQGAGDVPWGPYNQTQDWLRLGMRRTILQAARGGHDAIILPSPEQVAAVNHALSYVDDLSYNPQTQTLIADGRSRTVPPEDLGRWVGDELAPILRGEEPGAEFIDSPGSIKSAVTRAKTGYNDFVDKIPDFTGSDLRILNRYGELRDQGLPYDEAVASIEQTLRDGGTVQFGPGVLRGAENVERDVIIPFEEATGNDLASHVGWSFHWGNGQQLDTGDFAEGPVERFRTRYMQEENAVPPGPGVIKDVLRPYLQDGVPFRETAEKMYASAEFDGSAGFFREELNPFIDWLESGRWRVAGNDKSGSFAISSSNEPLVLRTNQKRAEGYEGFYGRAAPKELTRGLKEFGVDVGRLEPTHVPGSSRGAPTPTELDMYNWPFDARASKWKADEAQRLGYSGLDSGVQAAYEQGDPTTKLRMTLAQYLAPRITDGQSVEDAVGMAVEQGPLMKAIQKLPDYDPEVHTGDWAERELRRLWTDLEEWAATKERPTPKPTNLMARLSEEDRQTILEFVRKNGIPIQVVVPLLLAGKSFAEIQKEHSTPVFGGGI